MLPFQYRSHENNRMKQLIFACCFVLSGATPALPAEFSIPVETYKLKNGLRVILSRTTPSPWSRST